MNRNIETFIGCDGEYDSARIALFGAPFDSTTSFRPGARFGSSAIRHESFGLETYSPYQDKDLTDIKVFDCGDLELCFGSAEAALKDMNAAMLATEPSFWDDRYYALSALSEYLNALPPEQIIETESMRLYLIDAALVPAAQAIYDQLYPTEGGNL